MSRSVSRCTTDLRSVGRSVCAVDTQTRSVLNFYPISPPSHPCIRRVEVGFDYVVAAELAREPAAGAERKEAVTPEGEGGGKGGGGGGVPAAAKATTAAAR